VVVNNDDDDKEDKVMPQAHPIRIWSL